MRSAQSNGTAEKRLKELAEWVNAVANQLERTPCPGGEANYQLNKVIRDFINSSREQYCQLRAEGFIK